MVLIGGILSLPHQTKACEPQPDYWFAEVYSIGGMLLPEEIDIKLSPRDSAKGYLLIHNNAQTPLYVLPHEARAAVLVTEQPSITQDGLAEESTSDEILSIDQVPALAAYVVTSEAALRLDTQNLPRLVSYIEDRNILDFSRPGLVYLPIAQRGEFHLVHDEQIFTVQFTISYALNENFNPETCAKEIEPVAHQEVTGSEGQTSLFTSTIAFTLICICTLLTLYQLRKQAER